MKKGFLWLLKLCISGLIALGALTLFCMLYYNVPVHYDTTDGATDYSWEKDKFYSKGTEGFACGKTNNEGYLNTYDFSENEKTDILIMGSSHMEAYQVSMDESTSSVLGSLLPDYRVYNIGVSGHNFLVCADNLSDAVRKYKPSKYVVLETSNLFFTDKQISAAIDEKVPDLSSHSDGILGTLQKNQFLRLLRLQMKAFNNDEESSNGFAKNITFEAEKENLYNTLISKLSTDVSKSGAQLIIVYHSPLTLNKDGSASASTNKELVSFFADTCEKNNVAFIDMTHIFIREYEENHLLPHGFSNTSVGTGHLNKNGHKMIANAIYELIREEK